MKKFLLLLAIVSLGFSATMDAKRICSRKTYTKKASFAGFGKKSRVSGLPKTKITSGHFKRTRKGYALVNPYARS